MVTHDNDLARRVSRVIIVVDGQIVNQYVAFALATLDLDQLSVAASRLAPISYPPGSTIIRQGEVADRFYIITHGTADVLLEHPGGQEILVNQLGPGQYFGEIALLHGGKRTATVRAADSGPVEVMALDGPSFRSLMGDSATTREEVDRTLRQRLTELDALGRPR
jgi:CRP-like cAMP-binding protein